MFGLNVIEALCGQDKATSALTRELMEYQMVQAQMDALQASLEELCSAIEDFQLTTTADLAQDHRKIYCSDKTYTPLALVNQAHETAAKLEQAAQTLEGAKGRVLSKILSCTEDVGQYQALRYATIDLPACLRGECPIPAYAYL